MQGLGPQSCRLARDIQSITGCWQEEDSSDGDEMAFLYRKSKERNGNGWAGFPSLVLEHSEAQPVHKLQCNWELWMWWESSGRGALDSAGVR